MNFTAAISSGFDNYSNFRGRASRSEFWYWTLFTFLVSWAAWWLDSAVGTLLVDLLAAVALFLPSLAVMVRRLHDTNRSGWWYFIAMVPFVGWIALLAFLIAPSDPGPNRFN